MFEIKFAYLGLLLLLLLIFILLFRNIIKYHHNQTTITVFGRDIDSFIWLVAFIVLNFVLIFVLYYAMLGLSAAL